MENMVSNISDNKDDQMNKMCVEFYDHVPDFVGKDLEDIYQSIFTTVARMDIYDAVKTAHTYIVRHRDKTCTILLFRRVKNQVKVYNEQITLHEDEIKQFSEVIFSKYKSVSIISFYAISSSFDQFSRPLQKLNCLEDIVVQLPRTADDYLKTLSENTRASIRKSQKKVRLNFPSIQFETFFGDNIREDHIRKIFALSHARMSAKKRRFHYDEDAIQKLFILIKKYGVVLVAKNTSGICAGTICYRVGDHYFMHILAHDSKYNACGLGKLCCYLSICDAIEQEAKAYHFGWGRTNYKYAMGAKNVDLYRIEIYRSKRRLVGNIDHFLKMIFLYEIRRYKLWLERVDQGNTKLDKRIVNAIHTLRKIKSHLLPRDKK